MELSKIGFYTLTDERARGASHTSPLSRCELILSSRCNFKCPYCRSVGGPDIAIEDARRTINLWGDQKLKNIRFSGGEPTIYSGLVELVELAAARGIGRIALSTNGSAPLKLYKKLINAGVNDFSISLDACCAEDGDKMAGGRKGAWKRVIRSIRWLSKRTYVTVGVVLTTENAATAEKTVLLAHNLGVSDIRIIPAAQEGAKLPCLNIPEDVLAAHAILRYREKNFREGRVVRGAPEQKCPLVLDDMAVMGDSHYPCIIYMREGGDPIGKVSDRMREERRDWCAAHDCRADPICSKNCLDVCVDYNRMWFKLNK